MKTFKLPENPNIKPGFAVPKNYFEELNSKLLELVPTENEPKTFSLWDNSKKWIFAAAAVLVLALVVPFYLKYNSNQEDLDDQSIEQYLAYQSNISSFDLVNLMDEEDLQSMQMELKVDDKTMEEVLSTNNNLENYLIN